MGASCTTASSVVDFKSKLKVRTSEGASSDLVVDLMWTVSDLQRLIEEHVGVPKACQRLVFAGTSLKPSATLSSTGLVDGATVFVMVRQSGFPHSLGPFQTIQVPLNVCDFTVTPVDGGDAVEQGQIWTMDRQPLEAFMGESPEACNENGLQVEFPLIGQFSPSHPVTLTSLEKSASNIPESAVEFAWSYPIVDWEKLCIKDDALKSFLSVGGYVYYNSQHKIVDVTTLLPSEEKEGGLQLGRHLTWNPAWTGPLMRRGRFQPITIKSLRVLGARHFCWLRPGELITDAHGKSLACQPQIAHGGFAYIFSDDVLRHSAANRYFPIVSGADYVPSLRSESCFPALPSTAIRTFDLASDLAVLQDLREEITTGAENAQAADSMLAAEIEQRARDVEQRLAQATRCVVCLEGAKDTIFLSCSHVCACSSCAHILKSQHGNCPICRMCITEFRKAYLS
jgi:hypothetical protein